MDRNPRILIVEDEPSIRTLARLVVEHCNDWEAVEVPSGQEAIDAWQKGVFDLILMDVRMPVMSGITAARTIRAAEGGKHVPILAFTGLTGAETREACFAAGFDAFLSKPVSIEDLIGAIERYLPKDHHCRQ